MTVKSFIVQAPGHSLPVLHRRREMKKSFIALAVSGLPQSYLKKNFAKPRNSKSLPEKVEKEEKISEENNSNMEGKKSDKILAKIFSFCSFIFLKLKNTLPLTWKTRFYWIDSWGAFTLAKGCHKNARDSHSGFTFLRFLGWHNINRNNPINA